jgi:PAP2 superfamily
MRRIALVTALLPVALAARADVVTDWNRIAIPIVTSYSLSAPSYRDLAMMHIAMYESINAFEPRSQPYGSRLEAPAGATQEAAAAVAAARILVRLHPDAAPKVEAELRPYLARLADQPGGPPALEAGAAFGEKVAALVLESRANDGANAPDSYRPRTVPGIYIPTAPVVVPHWGRVTPFTLKSAAQFRPGPPLELKSAEWAENYNEIKQYGRESKVRTPEQTETARLWLYTGPATFFPLATQLSRAKGLSVQENARLYALLAMATADAMIAVFDAKYHYEFWRPVTAIRNGDRDGNPQTERDATWDAIGPTPMHPEYPCAHCIVSAAAGTVLQAFFGTGTVPEFSLSTPTAPGAVHKWTRIEDYIQEPANARIWAGIHYRFSTVVGTDMGRKIGEQAVKEYLRPL